ncbi:MAG TPA: serine hydrolase, partial [Niabella sp.]|nr:serine hydrolase [Niabella sp.]
MKNVSLLLFVLLSVISCTKDNAAITITPDTSMYFPANSGSAWETTSAAQLGWNTNAIEDLKTFLAQRNTKSFMILVNGRIVMEEYFNGHSASTDWEWNSAGKTLVSVTTGIAQQENLLNINRKVSDYLGTGWTNMPLEKENMITVRNLLTMTSGINSESQLVTHNNLTYVADAGTRWAYSNVFQLLMDVDANASNSDFETYFNNKLKNKIGMEGFWNFGIIYKIYHSNTKSMARFGLLALN